MKNPMDQKRKVIKLGSVVADNGGGEFDLPEVDEDNPHGARCAQCGELLGGGDPLICIDCDDDKNFGDACKSFYEG